MGYVLLLRLLLVFGAAAWVSAECPVIYSNYTDGLLFGGLQNATCQVQTVSVSGNSSSNETVQPCQRWGYWYASFLAGTASCARLAAFQGPTSGCPVTSHCACAAAQQQHPQVCGLTPPP
jgi:hypothetical protein